MLLQRAVGRFVELKAAEHRMLRLGGAGACLLIIGLRRGGTDETVGAEGLEFYRVGAGFGSSVDELPCESEVAVVIHTGLGDDKAGFTFTNAARIDLEMSAQGLKRSSITLRREGFTISEGERPKTTEFPGTFSSIITVP